MDVPMDYHVWGAMLEHYRIHMPKLTNIMLSWTTVLLTTRNNLLHEFINKAIVSFFSTDFDRGLLLLVGNDIVNTLFKYWVSIGTWYSLLKHLSCDEKLCKIWFIIHEYSMCNCMITWKSVL